MPLVRKVLPLATLFGTDDGTYSATDLDAGTSMLVLLRHDSRRMMI